MDEEKTYLTVRQAAELLGLSTRQVDRYCRRGLIVCRPIPDGWYGRLPYQIDAVALASFVRPPMGRPKNQVSTKSVVAIVPAATQ